jgi:hypothetical protein
MLGDKERYLKYVKLPDFEQLNQNMDFNLQFSGLLKLVQAQVKNFFQATQQGQIS